MGGDGWIDVRDVPQRGRPDKKEQHELQHVVLRGDAAYERMVIAWLDDVLVPLAAGETISPDGCRAGRDALRPGRGVRLFTSERIVGDGLRRAGDKVVITSSRSGFGPPMDRRSVNVSCL